MNKYRCPFCKTEIEDNIESLTEHRKPGGDCDTRSESLPDVKED